MTTDRLSGLAALMIVSSVTKTIYHNDTNTAIGDKKSRVKNYKK